MRIGELSKRSGISVDTLRYYEKEQLLQVAARQDNGYRHYNLQALAHLEFIQRAKVLGFSLQECRQLLSIFSQRDAHTCAEVKSLAEEKLRVLQDHILQLQTMNTMLQRITDACCGGDSSAADCSILNSFEKGDNDKTIERAQEHRHDAISK